MALFGTWAWVAWQCSCRVPPGHVGLVYNREKGKMEDKDFAIKFSGLWLLAMLKKRVVRREEDVKQRFMNGLLKCTNFSQETMALLSLVNLNEEGGEML